MTVLYRTYRPRTFADIKGQEHVVQTFQGTLASGDIGHAYLLCGPRGTGKTTLARLLAKALNCIQLNIASAQPGRVADSMEPCNTCAACTEINDGRSLDLIEIDAASNRGIDEIRNLKDSARVASAGSFYKIFLIDEVHMLTTPAFNALLKVLEEPPAHVVFILATTEPHKIPETILSRVQRFDLKKIPADQIITKLRQIAAQENLEVEESVFPLIAQAGGGSLRDTESLFGKLIAYAGKHITPEHAIETLGIVPEVQHQQLLAALQQKTPQTALAIIHQLHESGVRMEYFADQFIVFARATLIQALQTATPATQPAFLIRTIEAFTKAKQDFKLSPIAQLPLELAVIELTKNNQ